MEIVAATKKYSVQTYLNFSFVNELMKTSDAFFVIDEKVYNLYKEVLFCDLNQERLYTITAAEENKTVETALSICEVMTTLPSKRNTVLISVGGGIVQDITGFVADVLYRGIKWYFVPTTLLAASDSCIGGKTSLNYKQFKNLLGTFFPPDKIYICPLFFQTLSDRDFKSGLGEVVKFNVMYGIEGIEKIERDIDKLVERDNETVVNYVKSSLSFKKRFIEEDEFDRGERIKLNFAHTIGHAIESVTTYAVPHGSAVAMGMIVANYISKRRGWLEETTFNRINALVNKIISADYCKFPMEDELIFKAIRKDKKQINNSIRAVLMKEDTSLHIVDDVKEQEIMEGFLFMRGFLSHE